MTFHDPDKLWCYYVSPTQDPSEHGGWVPSVVYEDDDGYYPLTGDLKKLQAPWVWGDTRAQAEKIAEQENRKLGLTPHNVALIISSSMAMARRGRSPRRAALP